MANMGLITQGATGRVAGKKGKLEKVARRESGGEQ